METSNFFVESLGKNAKLNFTLFTSIPELNLGQNLIGEGVTHDEAGMASGTSQIAETSSSEEDDVASIFEKVTINLGLDVVT